ncbi:MAG: cupin domain-containing protein [Proteobacteria bacterium]|nr:cupin domain-containing protein [Pseudomonadota bacterium]
MGKQKKAAAALQREDAVVKGDVMDRLAFERQLRTDGYRVVNASLKPNMVDPDHCHDFDARLFVLGGEITITRDGKAETFRPGDCCEIPAGTMHAEHVGPEGVAYVAGRRRSGPLTPQAFEADLRREGFDVRYGGQRPGYAADPHAHDFDARIMVLGGEITLTISGKPVTYRAGDCCEVPAGTVHAENVGPEGVSTLAGIAYRRGAEA